MKKIFSLCAFVAPFLLSAQTYTGSTGPIADNATTDFPLVVSGLSPATIDSLSFGLETVCLNLTHTWDSDLDIRIISPDGTTVLLVSGQGGSDDNYTNTCFDETASSVITSGTAPFTGSFRPQGQLGLINNSQNGNGTWILRVTDMYAADAGNMLSWSLTFGNNPATATTFSSSNLPIVVINTNSQAIVAEPKITADMGIIYNGIGNRNHMTDPRNNYNGKVGIEIRGNYSAGLPQKPYGFETRDSTGAQLDVSLLGMPAEHDWCLIAMYNDKTFMRNLLSYYLFENMGHWAPRSQLCEVVLNGEYQGVYMLCEQIKRDNNRVNIAKLDSTEVTWPNVSGGYILKTDYWDATNSWQTSYSPVDHPGLDVHLVYYYPKPENIVPQQQAYIQNFIYDYETALYGMNFADTTNGYRKYISVRSFIDYFIVNELSRNVDGFKKSVYFYKEKDNANGTLGKLKAGPVWDFDWAWKDIWDCSIFQATDGSGWSYHINDCSPDVNGTGWYVRLLQDSSFANELNCRWQELRGTILDTTFLFNWIDSVAQYVNEAQQRHFDYWGNMGQATGTPEIEPPSQTFQEEIDKFKAWVRRRITWMDANMPGDPAACNLTSVQNIPSQEKIQTFPNPFSSEIHLAFDLPSAQPVQMELLNAMGQLVQPVQTQQHNAGMQTLTFTADATLPPGIYLLRVKAGTKIWTQRISKVE